MQTRFPAASIGQDRELVAFDAPGAQVPDGDGGYIDSWAPLVPPSWYVRIRPATARDAERMTAGTVLTHTSYVIHGRLHAGVTTASRMTDADGHVYQIVSVIDVDHRGREMELIADRQT